MADINIVHRRSMRFIVWPIGALVLVGVMWLASGLISSEPTLDTETPAAAEQVQPGAGGDQVERPFEVLPEPNTEPGWQPATGMDESEAPADPTPEGRPAPAEGAANPGT